MAIKTTGELAVNGGECLCRDNGRAVFVSDLIPGETAEIEITSERAGVKHGKTIAILKASPDRREPFCRYCRGGENQCGGCNWQHIAYERQATLKKEILIDCLTRIAKIAVDFPIKTFTSPDRGYRIRAQFKIDPDHNDVGFFKKESKSVVAIESCPVLSQPLNDFLLNVRQHSSALPAACRQIRAIAGDNGIIASAPVFETLSQPVTTISVAEFSFEINGNGFFQQNRFLLETMGRWVQKALSGGRCFDVYGGCGFFSVFLSKEFSNGILIEQDHDLAGQAEQTFARNGIDNFSVVTAPAERLFTSRKMRPSSTDCVVVDPPRIGLTKAVSEGLAAACPQKILYVSCDPATQARDLRILMSGGSYRIADAALFDLYPHTHHIESAILLDRA